jgi:hypothetical protein
VLLSLRGTDDKIVGATIALDSGESLRRKKGQGEREACPGANGKRFMIARTNLHLD